jgi:hypothetical protein
LVGLENMAPGDLEVEKLKLEDDKS